MDARVALEIRADGLGADLAALGELGNRVLFQLEAAEVVGEVQHAAGCQPRHRRTQQAQLLALHVEVVGAGGVGEGRRVAEDHVVLAALGFQPLDRIGLHQLVAAAAHAVECKVVGAPLQVGAGQVDAGGRCRASHRRFHAGHAGVAEQVEETLATRLLGHLPAQRAVIEEQAGIQVVEQVDPQQRVVLAHQHELAALLEATVLAAALAALARFQRHLLRRHREHLARGRQQFVAAAAHVGIGDRRRCGVFLHVQEGAALAAVFLVDVDGRRVFGQVGVIGAEAAHVLARAPALELLQVLAQPVGHHLRAFAQLARLAIMLACRHRDRVANDQRALDGTVEQLVGLARAQAGGEGQFGIAAQQAGAPLRHRALERIAEPAVQRRIGGQALVIGGIAHHAAGFLRRQLQVGHVAHAEPDGLGHAGFLGILLGRADRLRVDVAAVDHLLQRGAANALAFTRLGNQLAPLRLVETAPAAGRDAAVALQAGGDVGGHQRAFDQQRATAAHRVEQAAAFGVDLRPAGAQQHRRGQVFLQRRIVLRQPPAALVQRATAQVDGNGGAALAQRQVDAHVGELHVHRRPLHALPAQVVHHRVLDPLRGKARVGDALAGNVRVHRQGQFGVDVLFPRHRQHALVQRAFVRAIEFGQRPQHAAGQPRPQHHPLRIAQFAFGIDPGNGGGGLGQAQCQQLIGQQVFQALGAGDEEFHGGSHRQRQHAGPAIVRGRLDCRPQAGIKGRAAGPRTRRRRLPRGCPGGGRHRPAATAPHVPAPS